MNKEAQLAYNHYFQQVEGTQDPRAAAFDKIAERYFFGNFGTMSKTDFETLLFSLYLDQILDKDEDCFEKYSDYTLSKLLGIPQSKVSTLKVRKQLMYPYEKFEWRQSLQRVAHRTVFEDGKIKLQIPDKNLFLEIKNAVECAGGYVELQLTPNLLQIRPEYFLDLMLAITESAEREAVRKGILEKIRQSDPNVQAEDAMSIKTILANSAPDIVFSLIEDCVPLLGGTVRAIAETMYNMIKTKVRGK